MDLRKTRIRERCAALVCPPYGRAIGTLGIRRKIKRIPVASGSEHARVPEVRLDLSCDQVPCHDAPGLSVDDDEIEHLRPRKHLDFPVAGLAEKRLVCPQ